MKTLWLFARIILLLTLFAANSSLFAQTKPEDAANQMPSVVTVPPEAQPSPHFDPEAATNAYLAQIPATARARSDAYFEGGYWLILWDFLMSAVRLLAAAAFRLVCQHAQFRRAPHPLPPLQTFIIWIEFLVVTSLIQFPLAIYEGYIREHKYGLATQTFGPWLGDQLKGLLIGVVLGGLIAMILFGIVRRLPNTWHIWGAIAAMLFVIFTVMIAPGLSVADVQQNHPP